MGKTYAVVWWKGDARSARSVGKLALDQGHARLEGAPPGGLVSTTTLTLGSLAEVELDRTAEGRLDGRPSVALSFGDGERLHVASLDGAGTVSEIERRLRALATERR